jgi:ligand-binding SRPBCC domain-containing protein
MPHDGILRPMRIHRLEREQLLDAPLADVFAFFTDIHNLERITPPWMGFRISTPGRVELAEGAVIDYTIRLAGVPLRWRTRIVDWQPGRRFVDVQERGPYALWEHTHSFEARGGGVLMRDVVRYALPFGALGSLAHPMVRRSLGRIFDYRVAVLARTFAASSRSAR